MEARLIPQRQTSVVDEVQVPGNLLKPVTGYPRCFEGVVELLISGSIVSDFWESVDTHDNHETKVCLDLCHVCLPCGWSMCSSKTLCCKPVCLPYNQREDLFIKIVREHLQWIPRSWNSWSYWSRARTHRDM